VLLQANEKRQGIKGMFRKNTMHVHLWWPLIWPMQWQLGFLAVSWHFSAKNQA